MVDVDPMLLAPQGGPWEVFFEKKKKQNTVLKTTHTTDKLYLASNLFLYMLLIEISTVFCFALNILSKQKNNLEQLKELETEEKLNPKLP